MKYWVDIKNNTKQFKGTYNYKKGDYIGLKEYFKKVNWERDLTIKDINLQNTKFRDIYNEGIDKFIPKVKREFTRR